jgi:hypothetical protein
LKTAARFDLITSCFATLTFCVPQDAVSAVVSGFSVVFLAAAERRRDRVAAIIAVRDDM